MISLVQVQHIAKLARLGLAPGEAEKFSKQLSDIFGYMEILDKADTAEVEPTLQVVKLQNVMRKDEVKSFPNRADLLACTQLPVERDQIRVKPAITG